MSQLLTGQDVWPKLKDLTNARTGRAWCAIAYIGAHADSWLHLRAGDTLVCDASDGAVRLGLTSAAQLRRWVATGVAVYSRPGMHAKVGALSRWAFVGSADASDNSATAREEAVLVTADAGTLAQVREYVKGLLGHPSRVVDVIELERLDHIKVRSLPWPKTQPGFRAVIADGVRLQMWGWDWDEDLLTQDEERRATGGIQSLGNPKRRSDRIRVTFRPAGGTDVLPACGDVFCWQGGGWTYPPAPVELVDPGPVGGRAAVFYLVRGDLGRLPTDDVEDAIAAVDSNWKASSQLSPGATRAVAALNWARPDAKSRHSGGR